MQIWDITSWEYSKEIILTNTILIFLEIVCNYKNIKKVYKLNRSINKVKYTNNMQIKLKDKGEK